MKKRIVRRSAANTAVTQLADLHTVLQRVYSNRSIQDANTLEKNLANLLPFSGLKNINAAATLLADSIAQNQRIVIIGDFDADGATSTAIAVRALTAMGAQQVFYMVPDRFKYGYGLTPEIVESSREHFGPEIIVTVDNGISSLEGIRYARKHQIKVLVTDHHLPAAELPEADVIVNPNQADDTFASKNLAGVGVIFYVMLALRAMLRERGWFESNKIAEPKLANLLDIVALGTVADVVGLDYNNRILVDQGLKRIRAGFACPGIQALIEVANRNAHSLVASDLGFSLGPRLNAAGRLEDMSLGIACLLSDSLQQARHIARQLNELNLSRREIEGQMQQEAMASLAQIHLDENQLPYGIAIYDASWHQGVIGILASRIKDRFNRPTIVFADAENGEIKGSARSINDVHIRDVLDSIASQNPGLIQKFGGHAMAAGLSIAQNRFEDFKSAFSNEIKRITHPDMFEQQILSDGELTQQELSIDVAQILRDAEPWGHEFPEPTFDAKFLVTQQRIVGDKHLKLTLKPRDSTQELDAIAFNVIDPDVGESDLTIGDEITAAFRLDINEFRNQRKLQLIIEYYEVVNGVEYC